MRIDITDIAYLCASHQGVAPDRKLNRGNYDEPDARPVTHQPRGPQRDRPPSDQHRDQGVKTSELAIYIIVLGILIASAVTDVTDFGAQEAWQFITWLSIGYSISRGLAKLGSRDFYDDERDARHNG